MYGLLTGWVAGILLLQCSPQLLPGAAVLSAAFLVSLAGLLACRGNRFPSRLNPWILACVAMAWGFAYAHERAVWRLSEAVPAILEGQELELTGTVTEMPESVPHGLRFLFRVDPATASARAIPHVLSLAWFRGEGASVLPELHPGQRWRLHCRLKRPHGMVNPGGFDFETWALQQGVRATGAVSSNDGNRLLGEIPFSWRDTGVAVEQVRDRVRQRILAVLAHRPWAGVMVALVVGDQSLIAQEDWQLFWTTGVGHLISISGLHITLLAGLVARGAGLLWPSLRAKWMAGLVGAGGYALLAGYSVPTQRTLYMIGVVTVARFARTPAPSPLVWLAALFVVLAVDPWAPLSPGFWLSFGAVGALMYAGACSVGMRSALKNALATQWSATWAMVPLLLLLFGQVSLVSPVANAFAIPVVSLGVVPLALLGVIPGLGWALTAAHQLFAGCAWGLRLVGQWPLAVWTAPTPGFWGMLWGTSGLLCLLAPAGLPGKHAGTLGLLGLLLAQAPRPESGAVWMDVLDVGQGLAVVIRTQRHTLVYDTGPRYSQESDGGARVVLPALRSMGVTHLDGLVVSHRDTDHSGGGETLLKALPADWLLSSLEPGHPLQRLAKLSWPCFAGQHWEWEGVAFHILHPLREAVWDEDQKTNDRGCVLRVTAQGRHILIPADIEAPSERELLDRAPDVLNADVLIAPHHGSKTSSTAAFLEAVDPRWTIFTVGYRNHFGHPKPVILERYRARRIGILRTDETGAVEVVIDPGGLTLDTARARFPHYWDALPFSYTGSNGLGIFHGFTFTSF